MTRVLLLGPNGMLGTAIRECAPDDMEVVPWGERFKMVIGHDASVTVWPDGLDCIINTIGIRPERDPYVDHWSAYVNATVPHLVATRAAEAGVPVIHVSTDCVFGMTPESDIHAPNPRPSDTVPNPATHYGRTKLAGESEGAINVRTSFVGPRHGLWKWVMYEANKPDPGVDGWANAWWSGSTVMAVAQALIELARDPGEPRTLHLATEVPISKADVICELLRQLELPRTVVTWADEPRIDRSLAPDIVLPPFAEALREMGAVMELRSEQL